MATLTERQPGVWMARVFLPARRDGEKPRQVGKVFKGSKKAVKAEVAAWEAELKGTSPTVAQATIADLLAAWMDAKSGSWQQTTVRDQRGRCARITEDIGAVRLRELDPLRIDAWLKDLRRRHVGEGAIRGRVATLRAACTWGVSRRMLRSNPVAEAAPRVVVGRRSTSPTPEHVVALIAAGRDESERAALGLRLTALTGAREAEVVALQWRDLNGTTLRIARQRHSIGTEPLVRARTKSGEGRQVVLDDGTVAAIAKWRTQVEEIVGSAGEWMLAEPGALAPPAPRWLYDVFRRAAKRAGIATGRADGLVLHDLRHWAASTALRDGHDPVTVAARLGHSPETLMRVYAQEIEHGQVGVAASLAARLDGS